MTARPIATLALLLIVPACAGSGGPGAPRAPVVAPTELGLDGGITPLAAPLTVSVGSWSHLGNLCVTMRAQGFADSRRIGPTVYSLCGKVTVTPGAAGAERVAVTISDGLAAGLVVSGERDGAGGIRAMRASGPRVEQLRAQDRAMLDTAANRIIEAMPQFAPGSYAQGQVVRLGGQANNAEGVRSTCTVTGRGEIRRREVLALTCETSMPISATPATAGLMMRGEAVGTSIVLIETATGAKRREKAAVETAGTATDTQRGTTVPFTMTSTMTVTLD